MCFVFCLNFVCPCVASFCSSMADSFMPSEPGVVEILSNNDDLDFDLPVSQHDQMCHSIFFDPGNEYRKLVCVIFLFVLGAVSTFLQLWFIVQICAF